MQLFFETPFMFWNVFVFSFLICTGAGAIIQCWFLISFCDIRSRKSYYMIYLVICYGEYLIGIYSPVPVSPIIDTLIGAAILFIFINRLLKQNYILSAITATLTMAVTTLAESALFLLEYFMSGISSAEQLVSMSGLLLSYVMDLVIYRFFVKRYSIRSQYQSKYLLAFSLPVFFISIMLRTVNYSRYSTTTDGLILQSGRIQNYEMVVFTVTAFLCICIVLFAYEKTVKHFESENEKILLKAQISVQERYVEEAKQKYETTRAFRHDFKNHMIALRGLINSGEIEKSAAYIDRFEQIYRDVTFRIVTGNPVADILLSEKLSFAEQSGIQIQCDVVIPSSMDIDDFDLCTIFANAIDNAIKACNGIENGEKIIDIAAKPGRNFFVMDMINTYQPGIVPQGSGIGLSTIQIIAEKYHGAVEISDMDNHFRISVILPFDKDPRS